MEFILITNDADLVTTLSSHKEAKLIPMEQGYFMPKPGVPLRAIQRFVSLFCELTGEYRDRIDKDVFRARFRAYLEIRKLPPKDNAQIGREAKKHCGLETKPVWHDGKTRRMFTRVKFRD
ncbi:hypothetical protein LCGC14_2296100 [marine sediment metagenome]|uniref:Uncharacterized protein n=1 Tax=marine sediment metagenome TaxID=412755 RepID=A0A0F9CQD5_9ZZZZ